MIKNRHLSKAIQEVKIEYPLKQGLKHVRAILGEESLDNLLK